MSMFTKFFKGLIHKRDPEEHPVTVKEKPKPKFYGTVAPYPNFNASTDASVLQSAIESKHEDVIVSVLVKRNNDQRQMIKAVYESSTGKNLVKSLESVLSSHLEDASLALLMKPAYYDAHLLRNATKGVGTDEAVLVEVLATRSNKEIEEIKQVFKKEYGVDLERAIKDETSGDFTQALLSMLSAKKDESTVVDMELARKDAQILFEAAETSRKVNVSTFINILTTRSGPQLSKMKCAWNTPAFFAEKLCHAMKGVGTRDRTLIRILVSRSEVDLKKIVEEYQAMFGRSLQDDIVADTKGEYQKVLLGLCGAQ
ncbi:annexin A1 isoform X2 [Nothobranchius furzeri]|uniref:annexin A1 isoform X2 n=1 Tax=Nothobranchius furzeri TaxID=105023 RepID=UPI0024047323|nr:annexin A1 isoform X2 [Nothobranchius furzeri]